MRRLIYTLTILALVGCLAGCLAGCNLDSAYSVPPVTLASSPTPLILPTPTPTVDPASLLITPIPGQTLVESPEPPPITQNAIQVFVNNILIPVWNFFYTLVVDGVVSLWVFAGARGGWFAQVFCCIFPGLLVLILIVRRRRVFFWRR